MPVVLKIFFPLWKFYVLFIFDVSKFYKNMFRCGPFCSVIGTSQTCASFYSRKFSSMIYLRIFFSPVLFFPPLLLKLLLDWCWNPQDEVKSTMLFKFFSLKIFSFFPFLFLYNVQSFFDFVF